VIFEPHCEDDVYEFQESEKRRSKGSRLKAASTKERGGSGDDIETISGWITALCF
jgi:hypothetical protein